jgi:hypothetical protein
MTIRNSGACLSSMTGELLRRARDRIGELAGWPPHGYTALRFACDLEALHYGITGEPTNAGALAARIRTAMDGRAPTSWDKVVRELLERAIAGQADPPTRGPSGVERSVRRERRQHVRLVHERVEG